MQNEFLGFVSWNHLILLWIFCRCHSVYSPGGISSFLGWRPAQALPADQGWCLWCMCRTMSIQLIIHLNRSFLDWKVKLVCLFVVFFCIGYLYELLNIVNVTLVTWTLLRWEHPVLIAIWFLCGSKLSFSGPCINHASFMLSWQATSDPCELPRACIFICGLSLQPISYSKLFLRNLKLPSIYVAIIVLPTFGNTSCYRTFRKEWFD